MDRVDQYRNRSGIKLARLNTKSRLRLWIWLSVALHLVVLAGSPGIGSRNSTGENGEERTFSVAFISELPSPPDVTETTLPEATPPPESTEPANPTSAPILPEPMPPVAQTLTEPEPAPAPNPTMEAPAQPNLPPEPVEQTAPEEPAIPIPPAAEKVPPQVTPGPGQETRSTPSLDKDTAARTAQDKSNPAVPPRPRPAVKPAPPPRKTTVPSRRAPNTTQQALVAPQHKATISGQGRKAGILDPYILKYREQLAKLQMTYTDRHPDVAATRRILEQLEARPEPLVEKDFQRIREQIAACWSPPRRDTMPVVALEIIMDPEGRVVEIRDSNLDRVKNDEDYRTISESAQQAIRKCSPLWLPLSAFQAWRTLTLSLDPDAR